MDNEKARLVFARANEFKEGDLLVGGTRDEAVRMDAKKEIAALKIGEIARLVLVEDAITEALSRSVNRQLFNEIAHLTISDLKLILTGAACAVWVRKYSDGLSSEAIAALVKTMNNDELSQLSRSLFNPLSDKAQSGPVVIGSPLHFGSRIQPNSPGDCEEEILMSILEGLAFGCGDVIIGLNPASDDIETIVRTEKLLQSVVERLQLPTRYCVLSDLVKQSAARSRTKVDVGFQSLAGTSRSLVGMLGLDVEGLLELARGFDGLYFETGQGSEVTNGSAEGVDMLTLESRCYGLARHVRQQCSGKWMIVNDVAGFIGPEVFRTGRQLMRACLEDTVMAKLHGITMGLDVCSTFHMGIDPFELQALTGQIVTMAAPAYLMSVAGNADPMLGYLTTSYRQHPRLRLATNRQISSAMRDRLIVLGVIDSDGPASGAPEITALLYARYLKQGGDTRSIDGLRLEGLKRIAALQEKGCDLGYGPGPDNCDPPLVSARIETLYRHARIALYAGLDPAVIRACCPQHIIVATHSADREEYLAHPASGELISEKDCAALKRLREGRTTAPQVRIVISDGLNADAVNENLRDVLPGLRWSLKEAGFQVSETDVVLRNGRVRAGYHVAQITEPDILIHLIGERPGSGLNQLSAYMTYGRDPSGSFRWSPGMDHSCTSAICSIHPRGKTAESAIVDMLQCAGRMIDLKCSGVALGDKANTSSMPG
ncbi:MAG: ethanolamine ammonia-lyase subunit EutB [Desulfuromonadales bacterium]|nr:ethanolamine ammonia-lyase subunit EutB [Desulfuromonadales bacterium]